MSGTINTYAKSMAAVKAAAASYGNPSCKTGFYQIPQELFTDPPGSSTDFRTGLAAAINENHWWVYSGPGSFPSGSPAQDTGYGSSIANQTTQTPVSVASDWTNGLNYNQAAAVYEWNYLINGTGSSVNQSNGGLANPQCNFIWHDNRFWGQRVSGQWLCTSTVYGQAEYGTDTTVPPYLQAGYAQEIAKWRAICPLAGDGTTFLQAGNCDWSSFASPTITSYVLGLWDMPFSENMFGASNPVSQYFSPNSMLAQMAQQETLMSSNPHAVCIMQIEGVAPGVSYPASQSDWTNTISTPTAGEANNLGGTTVRSGNYWQAMRNAAAFAMLRLPNGWAFDMGAGGPTGTAPTTVYWLDEFQKGSAAVWNWLGAAIDGPLSTTNLTVGGKNLYLRRFANGNVWVNPIGNGVVVVPSGQLPGGTYLALSTTGFGDPAINNGVRGTSLTLQDGDGRFTCP